VANLRLGTLVEQLLALAGEIDTAIATAAAEDQRRARLCAMYDHDESIRHPDEPPQGGGGSW
jgi:hypothetical protein